MGAIIDFFRTVLDFLIQAVSSIVWLISNLPKWSQVVLGTIGYAPAFLAVFLSISLSVTVLFAILKRI